MLTLISLFLAAAAGGPATAPIGDVFYGHAMGHSDPIADMTPLPPKLPACRSEAEIQKALAEKAQRKPQSCLTPLIARAVKRDSDQTKP